jgi:hypothetical protein
MLAPGVYEYSVVIDVLLETDQPGDFAGVEFFATDSRFPEPLWLLQIIAEDFIASVSDLILDFTSNPILGLDDEVVEDEALAAFVISGGQASLSSYLLFSTSYVVDQTITFAEGVEAGIVAVPEPSGALLMLTGMVILLVVGRLRPGLLETTTAER